MDMTQQFLRLGHSLFAQKLRSSAAIMTDFAMTSRDTRRTSKCTRALFSFLQGKEINPGEMSSIPNMGDSFNRDQLWQNS
jgi:propanediol dehydratase large subunit